MTESKSTKEILAADPRIFPKTHGYPPKENKVLKQSFSQTGDMFPAIKLKPMPVEQSSLNQSRSV
jgi:hypothetical protein